MNQERDVSRPADRGDATGGIPWPEQEPPVDGRTQPIYQRTPDAQPTRPIGRTGGPRSGWHAASTQPIPAVVPEPGLDQATEQAEEQTRVIRPVSEGKPSLLRASGSMAIPTLISRITGFLWKLMLAWLIGTNVINDSFMASNNLPNSVFEFLVGGVLTSVIVPVLVRAEKSDSDNGETYIRRLFSISFVVLIVGTALSLIAAPLLVGLYVSGEDKANPELATAFAYLLLPQIFFYGLAALVSAVLQAKQLFKPPAWAPVVHNLVIIATIVLYQMLPGQLSLDPIRLSDPHLLTLGIGVTLGVVAQAFIQIPALRRTGFRFRWQWGWDPRLSEFGGLALWMVAYVLISQLGLMAQSQVGTQFGVWSKYQYVWMLLQLPYGVIGFSVMTAILPRMSAAAADGDNQRVIDDLSLGNRLSTVTLLPISAVMAAGGVPMALALFSIGKSAGGADTIGAALAVSSFGVLPYAITMMQMRVFYALKDARTPALIMVVMTIAKAALSMLCGLFEDQDTVLYGLVFTNSLTFVIGWLVGEIWLRYRLGPLGSRRFLNTLGKTFAASALGGALAWLVTLGADALIPGPASTGTGWLQFVLAIVVGAVAIIGLMSVFRVAELRPVIGRITGLLRRR